MDKIKSILKFAMRMERDAEYFYSFYMDKDICPELKKLFSELAAIEKQHFKVLEKKFNELEYTEPPLTISWVVDENFKAQDPHILSDNSDMLEGLDENATDIAVIRMAYLIETDFAHFYQRAAENINEPEAKKFLMELAAWENQHSQMFYKKYLALLDNKWKDIRELFD